MTWIDERNYVVLWENLTGLSLNLSPLYLDFCRPICKISIIGFEGKIILKLYRVHNLLTKCKSYFLSACELWYILPSFCSRWAVNHKIHRPRCKLEDVWGRWRAINCRGYTIVQWQVSNFSMRCVFVIFSSPLYGIKFLPTYLLRKRALTSRILARLAILGKTDKLVLKTYSHFITLWSVPSKDLFSPHTPSSQRSLLLATDIPLSTW